MIPSFQQLEHGVKCSKQTTLIYLSKNVNHLANSWNKSNLLLKLKRKRFFGLHAKLQRTVQYSVIMRFLSYCTDVKLHL